MVRFCVESGAFVCFGDLDAKAGEALAQELSQLRASNAQPSAGALFVVTDVTSYQSVLGLFQACLEQFGRIDSAVSCAGIIEIGNWFDPTLDLETVQTVSRYLARTTTAFSLRLADDPHPLGPHEKSPRCQFGRIIIFRKNSLGLPPPRTKRRRRQVPDLDILGRGIQGVTRLVRVSGKSNSPGPLTNPLNSPARN